MKQFASTASTEVKLAGQNEVSRVKAAVEGIVLAKKIVFDDLSNALQDKITTSKQMVADQKEYMRKEIEYFKDERSKWLNSVDLVRTKYTNEKQRVDKLHTKSTKAFTESIQKSATIHMNKVNAAMDKT